MVPPAGNTPSDATPGVGVSSRSSTLGILSFLLTPSTVPPSGGTPGGAFQVCPSLTPASLSGPVTAFHASAAELCATAITIAGAHGMPRKCVRYRRRILKMLGQPCSMPSSWPSQSSVLAKRVCTTRTMHVPPALASTIHSSAIDGEPGAASPSAPNRCGGSQMVIFATESMPGPKLKVRETGLPPFSANTAGTNHAEIPAPVAIARQTSSGVPGTSTSTWTERRPDASFLRLMMGPRLALTIFLVKDALSRRASAVSLAQPDLLVEVLNVPKQPFVIHPTVDPVPDCRHRDREPLARWRDRPAVGCGHGTAERAGHHSRHPGPAP